MKVSIWPFPVTTANMSQIIHLIYLIHLIHLIYTDGLVPIRFKGVFTAESWQSKGTNICHAAGDLDAPSMAFRTSASHNCVVCLVEYEERESREAGDGWVSCQWQVAGCSLLRVVRIPSVCSRGEYTTYSYSMYCPTTGVTLTHWKKAISFSSSIESVVCWALGSLARLSVSRY
jgi:hypothetical protein